ncbi:hypothetical protein JTB14_023911 [Gonioctena quinquepunctata]|nr:hypothetical protein JTB14_023911 [Gonioctena quinquepunctata]
MNAEHLRHVRKVHTYRGGTLMVWGEITVGGRADLIFPQGFLRAQQYLDDILQPIVNPCSGAVGENFHLVHDNDRPHVACIVTDWLNKKELNYCHGQCNLQT